MASEKIVTVFGSSRAVENSSRYKEAYHLGKLLAEAGFTVCNGGYGGTMAATSKGAKEAGGKTVGVTIDVFKKSTPNDWIDVESRAKSSRERLMIMTSIADAFIVLRGGIGTLAEMAFVWSSAAIGELGKPVILLGDSWRKAVDAMAEHLLIRSQDKAVLTFAETPEEALELLKELNGG
jgi:hypothetical protein